jgi:hypothetical protein
MQFGKQCQSELVEDIILRALRPFDENSVQA